MKRAGAAAESESMRFMTTLLPSAPATCDGVGILGHEHAACAGRSPERVLVRGRAGDVGNGAAGLVGAVGCGSQVAVWIGEPGGAAQFNPVAASDGEVAKELVAVE